MLCNGMQYNTSHFQINSRNIWFLKYSKLLVLTLICWWSNKECFDFRQCCIMYHRVVNKQHDMFIVSFIQENKECKTYWYFGVLIRRGRELVETRFSVDTYNFWEKFWFWNTTNLPMTPQAQLLVVLEVPNDVVNSVETKVFIKWPLFKTAIH